MKRIPIICLFLFFLSCAPPLSADPGDVNDDGLVNLTDAVLVIRLLSGDGTINPAPDADVNQDGSIGMPEAIFALQWSALLRYLRAPLNQFNIGDSIGEGEAANGVIRSWHHDAVWSTGYDVGDTIYSLNERFEDSDGEGYSENSGFMDVVFNKAVTGSNMADFPFQALQVVSEADALGEAGMITVFLGNNDVCKDSLADMADPEEFEADYRAGLDILAGSVSTKYAAIHVSGIPAIYWLWVAKKDVSQCPTRWWLFNICQSLLNTIPYTSSDDCISDASTNDPDTVYAGDGPNCRNRKEFHGKIRDLYNPILNNVLQEYVDSGKLPNAYFVDIFDIKFASSEVNDGDCFHPSYAGHKLLAEEEWCRSHWSRDDPLCDP